MAIITNVTAPKRNKSGDKQKGHQSAKRLGHYHSYFDHALELKFHRIIRSAEKMHKFRQVRNYQSTQSGNILQAKVHDKSVYDNAVQLLQNCGFTKSLLTNSMEKFAAKHGFEGIKNSLKDGEHKTESGGKGKS